MWPSSNDLNPFLGKPFKTRAKSIKRVANCQDNFRMSKRFKMSNQFQTVKTISDCKES